MDPITPCTEKLNIRRHVLVILPPSRLEHLVSDMGAAFFVSGMGRPVNANIFLNIRRNFMAFFTSAIDTLKILVVALGAGLGAWGVINLLEGYGNDNPGAKSQG